MNTHSSFGNDQAFDAYLHKTLAAQKPDIPDEDFTCQIITRIEKYERQRKIILGLCGLIGIILFLSFFPVDWINNMTSHLTIVFTKENDWPISSLLLAVLMGTGLFWLLKESP